jgi:hypothetical protein
MRARQEKESILNLQPISGVAVCAAIVTVYLAGAGSFPTQPVAGRESNQRIYLPG